MCWVDHHSFVAMGCLGSFGIHGSAQRHHCKSFPKAPSWSPLSVHSYYAKCSKQYMKIALPNVVFFVLEFLETNHGNISVFLPKMVDTAPTPNKVFFTSV